MAEHKQEPERCPRCGDPRLCNNWTSAGVCDNCWSEAKESAQRRLAKKYEGEHK